MSKRASLVKCSIRGLHSNSIRVKLQIEKSESIDITIESTLLTWGEVMKEEVEEPQEVEEVEEDHPGHPPQQHQLLRSYQQQHLS